MQIYDSSVFLRTGNFTGFYRNKNAGVTPNYFCLSAGNGN